MGSCDDALGFFVRTRREMLNWLNVVWLINSERSIQSLDSLFFRAFSEWTQHRKKMRNSIISQCLSYRTYNTHPLWTLWCGGIRNQWFGGDFNPKRAESEMSLKKRTWNRDSTTIIQLKLRAWFTKAYGDGEMWTIHQLEMLLELRNEAYNLVFAKRSELIDSLRRNMQFVCCCCCF